MTLITITHPDHPGVEKHVKASVLAVYVANGWQADEPAAEPDEPRRTRTTKSRKTTTRPDGAPDPKEQS